MIPGKVEASQELGSPSHQHSGRLSTLWNFWFLADDQFGMEDGCELGELMVFQT
jgi:hypothetical protein